MISSIVGKKDVTRNSHKLKRPLQDMISMKSETYRRQKEIMNALEAKKSPSELWNPYAWKLSLRGERKCQTRVIKSRISTSQSTNEPFVEAYGSPPDSRNKSVRFDIDSDILNKEKANNKSATIILQDKKHCVNDDIIQNKKRLNSSSFGVGMDYQFGEEVGTKNSGICIRVKSRESSQSSSMIIRKPRSIQKSLFENEYEFSKNCIPKVIFRKFNEVYKFDKSKNLKKDIRERTNSLFNMKSWADFFNLERVVSPCKKEPDSFDIPQDLISEIEIIGMSKLKAEAKCVKRIKGDKVLIRNHFYNEFGEGEPPFDEQLLS